MQNGKMNVRIGMYYLSYVSLLYEFPHLHALLTNNLHHIYPARQVADINSCFWFGDLLL